ncbi:hypothetical protein [Bacillus sp. FJAT-45037]|uniref:hypothetical protein n=1 Tax=Bacillus sp. FJAT-45037 TaxID=2011007 RepID=UPI000C23D37C|nr:hypothetical protein [Bacillus sp. FJAT-45037]
MPTHSNTASLFQKQKDTISFVGRSGMSWHQLFPISIRQTNFPAYYKKKPSATTEQECNQHNKYH